MKYIKNGSGVFIANANGLSSIAGNYEFKCSNPQGAVYLFTGGTTAIDGDFNLVDTVGANLFLGNLTTQTLISGKVDIDYNSRSYNLPFKMYQLKNLTGGGNITIQNPGQTTNIHQDTLIVDNFSILNYNTVSGNYYLYFNNNSISGNTTISDSTTNVRPVNLGGSTIEGNFNLIGNGPGSINESYNYSNQYNGNATFINNGTGQMTIGYNQKAKIKGDLNIQASNLLNIKAVELNGDTSGSINQLGPNPIEIVKLISNKSNGAELLLSVPVLITGNVEFLNGNILTDLNKELIFADNASAITPSDSSKVLGPVSKIGNDAFLFPIGSVNRYAPLGITAPSAVSDQFTANYIHKSPTVDGFDTAQKASTLERISDDYYFDLKRDQGTSNVKVSVGYHVDPGEITDMISLRVAHWDGNLWEDLGNGGVTGDQIKGTVSTMAAVGNFSPFTLATSDAQANPLPLKLIQFSGKKDGKNVQLDWTVTQEEDLDQYLIEKSRDGRNFHPIGHVLSLNHPEQTDYTYQDVAPLSGNNFYRLKIMEKRGQFIYSKIVRIAMTETVEITLAPNPAKNYITLANAEVFDRYEIYNQSGSMVLSGKIKNTKYPIQINGLRAGVYSLRIRNDHQQQTMKFIKAN